MKSLPIHLNRFAAAGLLALAAGAAQAAITVYTTQATFLAAVGAPAVDSFADLSVTGSTPGPLARTAGAYSYVADAPDDLFGAGSAANPALSTNTATDMLTLSNFSPNVRGVGGNFFGSDLDGAFMSGSITVVATDALGAIGTRTYVAGLSSFTGFRSTTTFTSIVISAQQPGAGSLWPTVDNLALAVPEPGSYALLLCGLTTIGWVSRRRRH